MQILPKKVILVNPTMRTIKQINLIAKELVARGLDVEILTDRNSIKNFTKKDGLKVTNVYSLMSPEYSYSEKRFIGYLKKYDINFEDFCLDEIIKPFERITSIKKRLLILFILVEKYLRNKKPDCIYNFSHTLIDRIVFKVAEKMKILNLHCRPNSPVNSWCCGLSYKWTDIIKKEFLYTRLDKRDRDKISKYVSKVVSRETLIASYGKYLEMEQISKKPTIKENLKDFYNYVFVDKKILRNPFFPLYHALREVLIKKIRSVLAKTYYSEPNFKEKFVYFPFQVPNDASITVHAPKFYRQDLVVDAISKSLPDGYYLYVKEHPNEKGAIPLSWIKNICALPNVKLVPVDTDSNDLIKNSNAVITITSETGWEGLLHLKPVIVLGHTFYSGLGITFDVEKMEYLPKIVKKALHVKRIDKYGVYKLINALIKSSCDCALVKEDKKAQKRADFLIKEYRYRMTAQSRMPRKCKTKRVKRYHDQGD